MNHYKYLDYMAKKWSEQNPDACPDCFGRPGYEDYLAEGGSEHAPWCKALFPHN